MRHLTRRKFLEESLFTATAALTAANLPAWAAASQQEGRGRKVGANDVIRVAVIGVHGRGKDHVSGYAAMNDVAVAAICDVDSNVVGPALEIVEKRGKPRPAVVQDLRRIMEDPSIDAVSIATCNHWHSLAGIWAMQHGKDVYVEKPVSHNVWEGRQLVEAARKHNRICQAGTQIRSMRGSQEAIDFIHGGGIGTVTLARGLCYKRRDSIGHKEDAPVPSGVDYDVWLGPAPKRPFNPNRFHYQWHWNWDYGNGDLGNQGIHQMDVARWGLNKPGLPKSVLGLGGRFGYEDDGLTPNTELVFMDYGDSHLIFEVRGLETSPLKVKPGDQRGATVGNIFYGTNGYLILTSYTGGAAYDRDGKLVKTFEGGGNHYRNFIDAMRSRKTEDLRGPILEGHLSSALCHLGNISYRLGSDQPFNSRSKAFGDDQEAFATFKHFEEHLAANGVPVEGATYRLGKRLTVNSEKENFGGDKEANLLLTREYRDPFVVPKRV
jgi:predicted dehydrogenase